MSGVPMFRLSAYYFAYFAFIGVYMPYFGLYLQQAGHSAADIGLLMSVMQLMRLLAPNVWGWLGDRLGRRVPILRLAALVSFAGFTLTLISTDFWLLVIALAVMGFFWTAQGPLTEALTFAHLREQPARYGHIRAWGSVGFIASTAVMGAVLDLSRDYVWVIWGGLAMLGGIVFSAFCVPEAPACGVHREEAPLRDILRQRSVRAFMLAAFFMSAANGALYVFYSIHLDAAGYSKTVVGGLWTLGVLAEILVFVYAKWMFERFSVRAILLGSLAVAVLRYLLIGWCVDAPVVLVLAQCMHGITFGAYHAAAVSAVHRWFGERSQAQGQALYGSLSFGAGGMVGGVVSGLLWETAGPGLTYTVGSIFAACGLIVLWRGWPAQDDDSRSGVETRT